MCSEIYHFYCANEQTTHFMNDDIVKSQEIKKVSYQLHYQCLCPQNAC